MSLERQFQQSLKKSKAYLHFSDGTSFRGFLNLDADDPRVREGIWGESAFTTAMSGYQETMTDPSYLGQHIIFATAHVGNYEACEAIKQSKRSHATALIARNFSYNDFLAQTDVPLLSGVDTRSLVKYLTTTKNSHKSVITNSETAPSAEEFEKAKLICEELERVGQKEKHVHVEGENPIALINYGCKQAIIEKLISLGLPLVSLPHTVSAGEIADINPRLIFLSNGPGDPRKLTPQIEQVKEMLKLNIPMRGICLGHQLLTLALGAKNIKLPFGQRGVNHPVLDHVSGQILITSQNHGYATEEESFQQISQSSKNPTQREFIVQHRSLFDRSIEGISSLDHFYKSVQFHPEAHPGPSEGDVFFREIEDYLSSAKDNPPVAIQTEYMEPLKELRANSIQNTDDPIPYKKILLVGSGPIKIGQASEFDYSGTQACKSLKELGIQVVLLNSNPATIMTDPEMAHRTYVEPITEESIIKIIEKEDVDAVLSTMGGQTALNICIDLEKEGYLEKRGVTLLGANVETIRKTEDRDLFAKELDKLGYQTGNRFSAYSEEEAKVMAQETVGYPLIIRRDFALGGKGAALVHNWEELEQVFTTDIKFPVTLEKSLVGQKEIELEVMVDSERNGVVICSIENIDPCGIHTGDSITVAPAQTISDRCYQKLRSIALHVAKHMGVVAGGANVQFAINPEDEDDITVIEMNPRVSRSSALASKATGYPIAKISAQLAVGLTLKEILNDITQVSPVAFEPTLDYVAVKIPTFPFNKFPTSSKVLGPQMRSVGEVLALGGSFNEAFLKALRSLEMGLEIPSLSQLKNTPFEIEKEYVKKRLSEPNELSLLTCLEALRLNMSVEEIYNLTKITPWFLNQVDLIYKAEEEVRIMGEKVFDSPELFTEMKGLGFSDKYLAFLTNHSQRDILAFRYENQLFPGHRAVDTCSGEFPALTPYFYSTWHVQKDLEQALEARPYTPDKDSYVILGSGPNRIGQGIEFDYSCVKSCQDLAENQLMSIMINSNPETVSTDYDSSNRLYLAPLFSEDIFDILVKENPKGVITCFSGQTGIKVRSHIEKSFRREFQEFNFLGSSMETLDMTEDRKLFYQVTKKVPLEHTKSMDVRGHKNLVNAMVDIGLPVIIRPSYVIGGESMFIFYHHDDIHQLPDNVKDQLKNSNTTFQVENYLDGAIEYDVDLVRDQKGHTVFTICEHIEHAGVHSGDSGMISPPSILTDEIYEKIKDISNHLAEELGVVGPINFQYAVKDAQVYCIEANPRGSRTLPFLSKAMDISLPKLATQAMLGKEIPNADPGKNAKGFFVKQSTFPFDRFVQDNIILGPKMRSTGETMGIDRDKEHAVLKSYLGNYPKISRVGKIMVSMSDRSKDILLPYLKSLSQMGYTFLGTRGTCAYIERQGLACEKVAKIHEEGISIIQALKDEEIVMVFNTPMNRGDSKSDGELIRNSAIQYGIPCFTRTENIKSVIEALIGSNAHEILPMSLQELHNLDEENLT